MFRLFRKWYARKNLAIDETIARWNGPFEERQFSSLLDKNMDAIKKLFHDVDIVRYKMIQADAKNPVRYFLVFCDGVVNSEVINEHIVKPLMTIQPDMGAPLIDTLLTGVVQVGESKKIDSFKHVIESVT